MNTLEVAYRILYNLEHDRTITPSAVHADPKKWVKVLRELQNKGYIAGVHIRENVLGETEVDADNAEITIDGAQYLKENSMMAKIAKALGHVIEAIS